MDLTHQTPVRSSLALRNWSWRSNSSPVNSWVLALQQIVPSSANSQKNKIKQHQLAPHISKLVGKKPTCGGFLTRSNRAFLQIIPHKTKPIRWKLRSQHPLQQFCSARLAAMPCKDHQGLKVEDFLYVWWPWQYFFMANTMNNCDD